MNPTSDQTHRRFRGLRRTVLRLCVPASTCRICPDGCGQRARWRHQAPPDQETRTPYCGHGHARQWQCRGVVDGARF